MVSDPDSAIWRPLRHHVWVLGAAIALPTLLVFNAPPSPTLLNQCLAIALWGGAAAFAAAPGAGTRSTYRSSAALLVALALIALGVVLSAAVALPLSIAAGQAAVIVAAAVVILLAGHHADQRRGHVEAFLIALLVAGALNAIIGCVQVFGPQWADGQFLARATVQGVAVGNLRQPNHLGSLLLWALIALFALRDMRRMRDEVICLLGVLLVLAIVLTGSRTGVLGVVLLALWGVVDRRLSGRTRVLLIATPALYAVLWFALSMWAHASGQSFAGERRLSLASGDISSSRFAIWSNTVAMIARDAWRGVGAGEFNFAWTLSAFPERPTAFFDHSHNLPLQLLAEFGVPLGALVIGLLLAALIQAGRRAWSQEDTGGVACRASFMVVLMIGVHSMLEYPLWYSYFLLPAAYAWGLALSAHKPAGAETSAAAPARGLAIAGITMALGAAAAGLDYRQVAVIYDPPDDAPPLEERIARGQRSLLFGHHADYAAATAFGPPKAPLSASQELAFKRAPHQLLDVRLMIAWSQALAAQGDLDKARWLAARIREFRNPGADEYFAPCHDPAQAAQAFQCQPPTREVHWREFVQR